MNRIILFAGTTEGRKLAEYLAGSNCRVTVCVATEYGKSLISPSENLEIRDGRLSQTEMEEMLCGQEPELVIDATHPYASAVTLQIKELCERLRIPYWRILREESKMIYDGDEEGDSPVQTEVVRVGTVAEAAAFLAGTKGNILIATGSKELEAYTSILEYQERCYARVLSVQESLEKGMRLGFDGANLIGMQGPFSRELNAATLRQIGARYFVTKESGAYGGFQEKLDAARDTGAVLVVVGRPQREEGLSLGEAYKELSRRYQVSSCRRISLIGIGLGDLAGMTKEAEQAFRQADIIFGAKRMIEAVKPFRTHTKSLYKANDIAAFLEEHMEYRNIAVALSGDVSFCSGAKALQEMFADDDVILIPGISSIAGMAARMQVNLDRAAVVSVHGKNGNVLEALRYSETVFCLVGGRESLKELCQSLCEYGYGDVCITAGSRLSYPDEQLLQGTAATIDQSRFAELSVVCLQQRQYQPCITTTGYPDEEFIRGEIPMTKSEVRAVSLSKLQLHREAVVWDIGAGTGSVAVECALRVPDGMVYAVEKRAAGVELMRENAKKFGCMNLQSIHGEAPECLKELPMPTHAFIGGSSGSLIEIIRLLRTKNPKIRIVVNAITIDTLAECREYLREHPELTGEMIQVGVTKAKTVGDYQMMIGQNPVYIITIGGNAV